MRHPWVAGVEPPPFVAGVDLHIDVERSSAGSGRSVEEALREAVRSGRSAPGTRLPGSRALAADLGLARGTVVGAYGQLVAEGWLIAEPGSGTRVADVGGVAPTRAADGARRMPAEGRVWADLRPGRPDLACFPRTAWASTVRRVLAGVEAGALDYGDVEGSASLRANVAAYVARARGVRATPDAVVVTAGFTHALAVLARALRGLGVGRAATEDPGPARHRELFAAAGVDCVPLRVDEFGADPAGLTPDTGVVLLTPAHQHPAGVVLSPARRGEFAAWARRTGGFVIEGDYDGEFRYDGRPVGALQARDPERVVFAALVLGYATPSPHRWRQALDLLGEVLDAEDLRAGPTRRRPGG